MQYPKISEYVKSDNLDMSTKATDEELNETITDEFGVKYSKDGRKLLKAPQELKGTYSIRKGTNIICDLAFCCCKSLKSLILPDSVIFIGNEAFSDCDLLSSLVIPNSVTSIGNSAFSGCSSLRSLVIPNSVTSIGFGAFGNCKSLRSLVIPDSITIIGDSVFWGSNLPNDLKEELISRFGDKIFG